MISTSQQLLDIRVTCKATHASLYELTLPSGHTVAQLSAAIEGHEDAEATHRVLRGLFLLGASEDNLLERPDALLTAVGIADGANLLADYPSTEAEAIAFLKGSLDAVRGEGAALRGRVAEVEKQALEDRAKADSCALEVSSLANELAATKDSFNKSMLAVNMTLRSLEAASAARDRSDEAYRATTRTQIDQLFAQQQAAQRGAMSAHHSLMDTKSDVEKALIEAASASRSARDLASSLNKSMNQTKRQVEEMDARLNVLSSNNNNSRPQHQQQKQQQQQPKQQCPKPVSFERDAGPISPDVAADRQLAIVVRGVPPLIDAGDIEEVCVERGLCNPRYSIDHIDVRTDEYVAVIVCNTVAQRDRMIRNPLRLRVDGFQFKQIDAYTDYFDQ